MDKKGKRCPNFNKTEEQLVLQLVSKYAKQVECKRSDTDTNKIKKEAWETIAHEFNSLGSGQFRDAISLKKKYENFKKITKKKHANQRMNFYKTGGGPSSQSDTPTDEDIIISSILSTQVEGCPSEFDGDIRDEVMGNAELVNDEDTVDSLDQRIQSPIIIISENSNPTCDDNITEAVAVESSPKSGTWGKYTPQMLKAPKNEALKSGAKGKTATVGSCRKTDLKTKLGQWAATKQLFVNTQEECYKREHELTMAHKKEKHEQEMRHAEELQQERLRQMREEHEQKMMERKGKK